MRAPTGNSHDRSSQSKPTAGGETNRRRKPVAGSTHSGCSARLTSAGLSPSMSASRRETVVRCAAASRPSTDAVGLTSPFSIRDREARLTPLSAESSSSDQLRARRNARRRSARRISAASQDGAWGSTSGRILSEMRASRRSFRHRARRAPNLRAPPFSCTLGAYSNGMDRCRRRTTPPPFRPGPGPSGRVASGSADSQIKEDRTK